MPSLRSPQDTIAAVATPLGEGGIGVIRLSGLNAIAIVKEIFVSPKSIDLSTVASHTCHFGMIVDEHRPESEIPLPAFSRYSEKSGERLSAGRVRDGSSLPSIDQVILTVFRTPHSYTGDDVVEISAHGSPFILEQILQRCLRAGARTAEPGEFTERAFLNGKLDLTQAEAVAELIHAKTEKSRAAAMAQLEGRLAVEVRGLRDQLVPMLAHIEVGLDHSDEDHDFLQREMLLKKCAAVQESLSRLLASERVGKILRQGLRVALVGRPNVGKSSLLNALLREERAIVTPIAGTTRDTLEETVNWDGLPVILTDTAGLRAGADDPVEKLGIERSHRALEAADLRLGLFDGSQPLTSEDRTVLKTCQGEPHLWILTKCDLPRKWEASALKDGGCISLSAKTGEGLAALIESIKQFAQGEQATAGNAQWMLNARHRDALIRAQESLARAAEAAQKNAFEECIALEFQTALSAIGEIIGETSTDDLLGQIFSQFCIGK